jgi:RNA polymerase sigma-70 factor (ECF subfamily)
MSTQRLSEEDRRRFAELYGPLRRFAAVVAGPGLDADDLLQEALVRVAGRGSLAQIDHPAAYLRRTILNLATKSRTRARLERRALTRYGGSQAAGTADSYPSDLAELLRVPPQGRAVLYLAEVEGYRYEDIARMLGCTATTARKRASRARRRLREALGAEV